MAPVPVTSTANLPEEAQRFERKFNADEPTLRKIVKAFRDEFGQGASSLRLFGTVRPKQPWS